MRCKLCIAFVVSVFGVAVVVMSSCDYGVFDVAVVDIDVYCVHGCHVVHDIVAIMMLTIMVLLCVMLLILWLVLIVIMLALLVIVLMLSMLSSVVLSMVTLVLVMVVWLVLMI